MGSPSGKPGLNRKLSPIEALDEQLVVAPFEFQVDNTGAVVAGSLQGDLFASASKAGTGLYLVTLKNVPPACVGGAASCNDDTTPVETAQLDWDDVLTDGFCRVLTYHAGTLADPGANFRVSGHLVLKKTKRSSRKTP